MVAVGRQAQRAKLGTKWIRQRRRLVQHGEAGLERAQSRLQPLNDASRPTDSHREFASAGAGRRAIANIGVIAATGNRRVPHSTGVFPGIPRR